MSGCPAPARGASPRLVCGGRSCPTGICLKQRTVRRPITCGAGRADYERCRSRLMLIRCARAEDAGPAADLVRRSITELCGKEYRGDAEVLARWLANKTPEDFRRWIGSADRSVCLAVGTDGRLAAVGMVAWRGEILLNFVVPEARFLGVSKAVMAHMEDHLRERCAEMVTLHGTHVARGFYLSLGYEEVGRMVSRF